MGQSAATAQAVLNAEKRTIVAMPRGSISGGSQGGSPGAAGDIRAGGLLTGGGGLPGSTMATRSAGAPDGIPATTGTRQAGGDGMVGGLGGVENSSPKEYLSSDIRGSASPLRGIDRSTLFRSLRSFSAAPASAFEVARGAWTGHPEKWMALTGDSLSQGRRTESWRMQIVGDPIPSQEEAGTGAFSFTSAPKSAVPPVFDSGVDVSRFQGQKVLLSAVIRKTGSVAYVQVRRGVHPAIDSSLQQALEQWDFRPPMRGDTPVPVDVLFEVAFEQEASP